MSAPNPIRSQESLGVVDQTHQSWHRCPPGECKMISIKVNSKFVRYVEECANCGGIDGPSLDWWAEDAIKCALPKQAQRIAVASVTEPFAFVQSPGEELELEEVLVQALAAAASAGRGVKEKEAARGTAILHALLLEVRRFNALEVERRLTEIRDRLVSKVMVAGRLQNKQEVLDAVR